MKISLGDSACRSFSSTVIHAGQEVSVSGIESAGGHPSGITQYVFMCPPT
jgi:hypothetical protein